MTLATLKALVDAIQRGEYERWSFNPAVGRATAVELLTEHVRAIAWQPAARKEAFRLLDGLNKEPQS